MFPSTVIKQRGPQFTPIPSNWKTLEILMMLLELSNIQLPGIAIWNQTNLIAGWLTVGCIHKYNYYDGVLAPAGGDAWARAERASCRATDSNWLSWSWFLPNLSPPGGCCFFSAVFTVKEEEDFFYTGRGEPTLYNHKSPPTLLVVRNHMTV